MTQRTLRQEQFLQIIYTHKKKYDTTVDLTNRKKKSSMDVRYT